jgi:tRNA modification GTPase
MIERPDSLADTIVACATAVGEGAIAIVRLAGPEARAVGRKLGPERADAPSHQLVHTRLEDLEGKLIDDAMVVEMRAPHSYTGDDVVELHVHGSRVVVQAVLETCLGHGARLARPGEFTLRAFLNGRMDLAQAEAVADLIGARSDVERHVAARQLDGELSATILALSTRLEEVLAVWRAALDFPEQLPDEELKMSQVDTVTDVGCKLQRIIDNSRAVARGGLRVVLCGATNVGKSTILNAWVGETRVLVDSQPGTTRDPIEVELFDGPIRWSVWDTAGIRADAEGLEARGIELSMERIRKADVAVWLVDAQRPVWPEDDLAKLPLRAVGAKADLASDDIRLKIEAEARSRGIGFLGWVSVRTGEGIAEIRKMLTERLSPPVDEGVPVVVRDRHIEALRQAIEALDRVLVSVKQQATLDLLSTELEDACRALGRILGRDVDASVLDRIFSEFCLGK